MEFNKERAVFIREVSSKLYGTFPYFIAKQLIELPLLCFLPLMENAIIYFLIGYRRGTFF
jgi:hypothetical protein